MTACKRLGAAVQVSRPGNCALTALSAVVGGLTSGAPFLSPRVFAAAGAAALISAGGNAFNDVIDLHIDAINRPSRPLPAGRLTRFQALLAASLCAATGVLLACVVSWRHGLVACAVSAALILYSLALKRTVLWGNLLVAALAALVFPFGATAAGAWGRSWIPAGFALLFHLGREIVKDMEDVRGDRTGAAATLSVRHGTDPARRLATAVFLVLLGFTFVPWITGLYGVAYGLGILVLAALVLHVLARLGRDPDRGSFPRPGEELKIGMLVGLLAIVAGELLR